MRKQRESCILNGELGIGRRFWSRWKNSVYRLKYRARTFLKVWKKPVKTK